MDDEIEERTPMTAEVVGRTLRHIASVVGFCFVVYVVERWSR